MGVLQVEFPEARIYEETLNVLLYEHRNCPDADLMQATSVRGTAASNPTSLQCTSDDEEETLRLSALRAGGGPSAAGVHHPHQHCTGLARLRSNKNN